MNVAVLVRPVLNSSRHQETRPGEFLSPLPPIELSHEREQDVQHDLADLPGYESALDLSSLEGVAMLFDKSVLLLSLDGLLDAIEDDLFFVDRLELRLK